MITNVRENEDIMKKLERILGVCNNTRDNIEKIISKYSSNMDNFSNHQLKEDLSLLSANLNAIMIMIDPIFRLYLIVPNNTENENVPLLLNTRKSDGVLKYENYLYEQTRISDKVFENQFYNTIQIEASNSPNIYPNYEVTTKIKENMNTISTCLSKKLKERFRDINKKYVIKSEEKKPPTDLIEYFECLKIALNK